MILFCIVYLTTVQRTNICIVTGIPTRSLRRVRLDMLTVRTPVASNLALLPFKHVVISAIKADLKHHIASSLA